MSAVKALFAKSHILSLQFPVLSSFTQQHGMSQYPSYYIEPIYRKEHQKDLSQSGEIDKYSHVPTRAALSNQTCSFSFDPDITLFTNYVMRHGRKSLARELVEKSLENVKRIQLEKYHKCTTEEDRQKIQLNPKVIFHDAIENIKPLLQLMPVKRGGVKYQVPVPITDKRSQFIAMNWLIDASKEKDRKIRFSAQLARELIDAANNTGRVVRRKQDLHKQCEANKAFAHYRWS